MAVVRRAPHEFKIACLEVNNNKVQVQVQILLVGIRSFSYYICVNLILQDIKKLFPQDYNPFYAGFGNRDTDELSYRKIGIPKGKIFIINPKVLISNCRLPYLNKALHILCVAKLSLIVRVRLLLAIIVLM